MITSNRIRRIGFFVLIGLSLLACKTLTGGLASPTPAQSPAATRTPAIASPRPTATVSLEPTSTALPSPTITALPSPTPALGVDLNAEMVSYAERPAWRALLSWPDECEEGFDLMPREPADDGGVTIYPLDDKRYLVFVTCTLGPYWVDQRAYRLDAGAEPLVAQAFTVPEWVMGDPDDDLQDVEVIHGLPVYDPDTQTLSNLAPARGLKDCGIRYEYRLDQDRFVLVEARFRECDDNGSPPFGEWPLVYPAQAPEYAGPFRKVALVDPELIVDWMPLKFELLLDGGLRLTTDAGYATFRDGAWDTHLLTLSLGILGVDANDRVWSFASESVIGYQSGGGQFTPASNGWLPVEDWTSLRRHGVVSDAQGQVWVVTGEDVRVFDGEKWTTYTQEAMGMPPMSDEDFGVEFTLTYVESRQQMWVGRCDWGGPGPGGGGGVRWFDGQAWRGSQTQVAGGCVTAIAADAEGRVWIGQDHGGVWLFDQTTGNWRQHDLPEPEEMRKGYPIFLILDPSGDPWLLSGLCGGASCDARRALYHFQDGDWAEVAGLSGYSEGQLYNVLAPPLLFDGAGTPWFFFGGMAFRIEDDRLVEPPDAELYTWTGDTDTAGQLWLIAQSKENSPALWVLESE